MKDPSDEVGPQVLASTFENLAQKPHRPLFLARPVARRGELSAWQATRSMGAEQSVADRDDANPQDSGASSTMGPTLQNINLFNPSAGIVEKPKPWQPQPSSSGFSGVPASCECDAVFGAPQYVTVKEQRFAGPSAPQRPLSPTESDCSGSDLNSVASSEAGILASSSEVSSVDLRFTSPNPNRHVSLEGRPDIVRSNTKSAVQEAAEAAAAAGWTGRKSEERSAARIAFMEHLKNMQAYADKKGVTPKHWNMYSAVHTGEEAHEIGRPDGL